MRNPGILALSLVAGVAVLYGAASVNQIYVSAAIAGDDGRKATFVIFDPPFTMSRDPQGRIHVGIDPSFATFTADSPLVVSTDPAGAQHLGVKPEFGPPVFNRGFVTTQIPGSPMQVNLDSAMVAYRMQVPDAMGECTIGTGVFMLDPANLWLCAPKADGAGFVMRSVPFK